MRDGAARRDECAPIFSSRSRPRPRPLIIFFSPFSFAQEYVGKLASSQAKGDDYETAAAQIGVEVYSAMNAAVGSA
jgi:hypothetical protein